MRYVLPLVVVESLRARPLAEKVIFLDVIHRPQRYVQAIIRVAYICWSYASYREIWAVRSGRRV
jgi:hypothetical protein